MKSSAWIISACFMSLPVFAQTYKCTEGGKIVYADRPCGSKASVLNLGESDDERKRLAEAGKARNEAQIAASNAARQVREESASAAPAARAAASAPSRESKQAYCDRLVRTAKDAKDESNKWRYHQGLIDDAKRRQKEAEDAHFSECYGSNF